MKRRAAPAGSQLAALVTMQADDGLRVIDLRAARAPAIEAAQPGPLLALRERIGDAIGRWWAPAIGSLSRWRSARAFHPVGLTFGGHLAPVPDSAFSSLAGRLHGHVLARLSPALWQNGVEWLDVLCIALRIRRSGVVSDHHPAPNDQDLLFATVRSPLSLLTAPLTTDASDFISNAYWAVSPFSTVHGRVELRLRPLSSRQGAGPRQARLREAVVGGRARWTLEARRTLTLRWQPLAHLVLDHETTIDQEALRFDPFLNGLDIVPAGLVHAIRRATYAASQRARPTTTLAR